MALPFATSYIPTVASTVTRSADMLAVTYANNMPSNSNALTILMDFNCFGNASPAYDYIFNVHGQTHHFIALNTNNQIVTRHSLGAVLAISQAITFNQKYRVGSVYNGATLSIYMDGVVKNTITPPDAITGTPLAITIGTSSTTPTSNLYGHISNVRIYNDDLTAQEMALA